jgi:hypothetical protein
MNTEITNHIESAVDAVRALYLKAATRIEAIKPGEKIPATQLANELAVEQGTTGPALYPVLKMLLVNYPGVEIKRGATGGIYKLAAGEVAGKKKATEVVPAEAIVVPTEVVADIPVSIDTNV